MLAVSDTNEEDVRRAARSTLDTFGPLDNFIFLGANMMIEPERAAYFKSIANSEAATYGTGWYVRS